MAASLLGRDHATNSLTGGFWILPLELQAAGAPTLAIAPGAVKFYEGRSEVVSATVPHEGALTMEVAHSSEGTTARETHALVLDDSGTKLAYHRRGAEFTYTRCD